MVKKCLIAIAVVGLLATTVQAATFPAIKHDGSWPYTYIAQPICTIPVLMEVGHYVQIYKCNELKMKLYQVDCVDIGKETGDFPCYGKKGEGDLPDGPACVTIRARANFAAVFGADFDREAGDANVVEKHDLSWPDGNTIQGGTGDWERVKLCMIAWKVQLWKSGESGGKVKVGEITINVKPPDGP